MAEAGAELKKWLRMQMPSVQKKVKAVKLDEDEFPLHVGPHKIRSFYPRIPGEIAPGEDNTVGRVCCSLTLGQALWGGRHHFPAERLYLYRFVEDQVLIPSTALTQEGKRGNEVWIVPHRMENWNIKPEKAGEARLISRSSLDEWLTYELSYIVRVTGDVPIPFERGKVMQPGRYYEFRVVKNGGWKATEDHKDVFVKEEYNVLFVGETEGDLWARAALEYTVKLD